VVFLVPNITGTVLTFECQAAAERDGYTKRFEDIISDQVVSDRVTHVSKGGLQDTGSRL
jgi:hypothetical protein